MAYSKITRQIKNYLCILLGRYDEIYAFNRNLKKTKGCYYFLHLGKTGGGSLAKLLHTLIRDDLFFQSDGDGARRLTGISSHQIATSVLESLPIRQKKLLKFIMGHLPFSLCQSLPTPVRCLTVLREPIDREISSFYYLRKMQDLRGTAINQLSVKEYAFNPVTADNYQVRVLSGIDELNPIWQLETNYQSIQGRQDILAIAKENLRNHFVLIGLLESLNSFSLELATMLNHPALASVGHENITLDRLRTHQLTTDEYAALKTKVDLDLQLYDWVKKERDAGNFSGDQYNASVSRLIK